VRIPVARSWLFFSVDPGRRTDGNAFIRPCPSSSVPVSSIQTEKRISPEVRPRRKNDYRSGAVEPLPSGMLDIRLIVNC
jgi:hypothetical protein